MKDEGYKSISRATTHPIKPEQEPVAWPCVIETADFEEDIVTLKMQSENYSVGVGLHWLSTTPPQRKPLTDEEIIASNYPDGEENGPTIAAPDFELICFARQIEAAHNIFGDEK